MNPVLEYHQNTKHSFHRFARSLGYLDWAAQPNPFRRYDGAAHVDLPHAVLRPDVPYTALFDGSAVPAPIDEAAIGEFLRCSMGLSAWKQYERSRWALRVNPSSGNLHPTECYIVWNGRVCHYAPRDHLLEVRAELGAGRDTFIVGLTSILWREAWKYGERAFRYCQHDVGHAIGALRFAAALLGWRLTPLDASDTDIDALLGLDRDQDYAGAEREEGECLLLVSPGEANAPDLAALVDRAAHAAWSGRANALSPSHAEWPAIDDVARATRRSAVTASAVTQTVSSAARCSADPERGQTLPSPHPAPAPPAGCDSSPAARQILLQRRSALGFDASTSLPRPRFMSMLRRLDPVAPPWDAIDWPPHVHLVLFVHRVDGLHPGLYAYVRDATAVAELRTAMRADFLWEPVNLPSDANLTSLPNDPNDPNGLFLLVPTDVRFAANRLSCDQDIASDGFFGMAMLARTGDSLSSRGDCFYRRLFWECGLIGQVLYLEAEAAGARATGIGCFYDDEVHDVLGLEGMSWQSLYHFSMGVPVDDGRLTSDAGYPGGW